MDAELWGAEQRDLRKALRAMRDPQQASSPLSVRTHGTDPLASVIVVCWNSGAVIGRCLEHLLAQDYSNYEVVVVDDGSRDETLALAQSFAARSAAVRVVHSRRNRGCPHARNLGVRAARGEIVAFIDADGYAASDWLRRIVATLDGDATIGAVASTVFFDANPIVINGAGGTANRQGWAADLAMNESYEWAPIASEALYPMGCGMALRRSALEGVGPFDDRMLNYYDDVDYGTRVWRAGYRVAVAPDAWIDHGFGHSSGDSDRKQLLCERHRMRVVLKQATLRTLPRWVAYEARALRDAPTHRRLVKLRAMVWNARHLPSVLGERVRMRGSPVLPDRLIAPSWGEGFPAGVASRMRPRPEGAASRLDMRDPDNAMQLIYGWFPVEHVAGRSYRWTGARAAAMVTLEAPAKRLQIDYAHVPADVRGVELSIRQTNSPGPPATVWSTRLHWQYIERSVENHPVALAAGSYEILLDAGSGWAEPPPATRTLGLALTRMSFEEAYEIRAGALDMSTSAADGHLVRGWFEAEQSADRGYRWAMRQAAVMMRVARPASEARLTYRFPPGERLGTLDICVCSADSEEAACALRILGHDADWHEDRLAVQLAPGDYLVTFKTDSVWSNPGGRDSHLPPENRSFGFALSALAFC
jgi:GT2 family glycosyltransferase